MRLSDAGETFRDVFVGTEARSHTDIPAEAGREIPSALSPPPWSA